MEQENLRYEVQDNIKNTGKDKEKKGPLFDLYSLLHDLVYILAAITLIFVFCVRLVGVNGGSMLPTLVNGDYLALQSNLIMGDLEYGDIIVARKLTFRDGEPIVKRVIATEGQTVSIREENGVIRVYVDGVALIEPYTKEQMDASYRLPIELTVEENCVFVMGDNRNSSADSRDPDIGQISLDQVLGKVLFVIFPGEDAITGERDFSRIGAVS